jgi:hypothetical protein
LSTLSLRDLARVSFPNRGDRGMFVMLEFYFDDSGTHGGSKVVVWGGVVGHQQFMDELEVAWKSQLSHPCDGKPPINAFHSSHLAAGKGEFEGYSPAEKDLTRNNFRKIIVDAGLTVLSFGISADDWANIVTGRARLILGSAERLIFGQAVLVSCRAAKKENLPLSFQFDKGRDTPELHSIIKPALEVAEIEGNAVSYGFSPVAQNTGLQAADLVAHETYQFFVKYIFDEGTSPGPHLAQLFRDAHDAKAAWIGKEQIQNMVDELAPSIARMEPSAGA